MSLLAERISQIQSEIQKFKNSQSCADICLIAASKKQSTEVITEAFNEGIECFGENYIQELKEKTQYLQNLNCQWHFIGPLQKNKASAFVSLPISCWHSLDNITVAQKVNDKLADGCKDVLDAFVQVNFSEELSKSGLSPKELPSFLEQASDFSHLRIVGLMTLPNIFLGESHVRSVFCQAKKTLEQCRSYVREAECFHSLSMGTSQDYIWALEEGATHIRLGEALLGTRIKS